MVTDNKDQDNIQQEATDLTEENQSVSVSTSESLETSEHLKDQLLRALAEAENIRKRSDREKEDMNRYAISKFAKDLLSLSDTLETALKALPETIDTPLKGFIEGIHMANKELYTIFERHGIKRVHPLNEPFDHNFHQAMFEKETEEEPNKVIQVLQTGFTLHGRLLRPALVGVSK